MNRNVSARLFSFALAALVTFGLLAGIDAQATHGTSAEALLAQQQTLQLSCVAPAVRA